MSLATKTYVIANGNPNDGSQVEQNFNDLIGFMNNSMPHSDGTGGVADIRGLVFRNAVDNGKKVDIGLSTINLTNGQDETSTVINFSSAFGAAPVVVLTQFDTTSNSYVIRVKSRSTTSFTAAIRKPDNTAFGSSITTQIFWIAIG